MLDQQVALAHLRECHVTRCQLWALHWPLSAAHQLCPKTANRLDFGSSGGAKRPAPACRPYEHCQQAALTGVAFAVGDARAVATSAADGTVCVWGAGVSGGALPLVACACDRMDKHRLSESTACQKARSMCSAPGTLQFHVFDWTPGVLIMRHSVPFCLDPAEPQDFQLECRASDPRAGAALCVAMWEHATVSGWADGSVRCYARGGAGASDKSNPFPGAGAPTGRLSPAAARAAVGGTSAAAAAAAAAAVAGGAAPPAQMMWSVPGAHQTPTACGATAIGVSHR